MCSEAIEGLTGALHGLEVLAAETGADELLITTITHDHAARVRSYQLLAEAWRIAHDRTDPARRILLTGPTNDLKRH